jgi:hypothetical protein
LSAELSSTVLQSPQPASKSVSHCNKARWQDFLAADSGNIQGEVQKNQDHFR